MRADNGLQPALRMSKRMTPLADDGSEPYPAFVSAENMRGNIEREFKAEGDVEFRKIGTVLTSDRMTYWPLDDEVEAEGSVRLEKGDDWVTGPKMRLKLKDQLGFFEQPTYFFRRQPKDAAGDDGLAADAPDQNGDYWNSGFALPKSLAIKPGQTTFKDDSSAKPQITDGRGSADRLDFEGANQYRLTNSTYTTCVPGNDDWYTKTESLKLDYDRLVGEGSNGTVYFKDVPIFYWPWLSFPLNNGRKSGFLAPKFGTSSISGVEFELPYYWNIAPNMDATITPRVLSKRGLQLNNEFRYLNTAFGGLYSGEVRAEWLPNDNVRDGDNRYGVSWKHTQATDNGFTAAVNYNRVSDDHYYTDLSSDIATTSETQLLQQATFGYSGGWWNSTVSFQQYQTLQPDAENPVREQYKLLPQITVNARKPDLFGTDSSFVGQFTHFTRDDQTINSVSYSGFDGQRTVLYPQVSFPYVQPGWYVTPKVGVNYRHYALSGQDAGAPGSIDVTLPILSVDSGMTFERSSKWFGKDYTQTLEPRLFYLNVPYRDQSQIPLFDTALADFNFAQIFSENQFSGWDRISSANQLTAAVTTRLIEPGSGVEIARAMLGQRFYFSPNKVELNALTASTTDKWAHSDVLAAFSGQVLPRVYMDTAWQYNLADRQVKRFSVGARYQPEPGKTLNAAYRYYRDTTAPVNQIDLSGQWPLSGRWYAVGRLNYSLKDDATNLSSGSKRGRVIESLGGLEYNGGCWVVRGVIHRKALTEDNASTAFFIQLELNGFSKVGSNPLSLLKRNIQGYSLINQSQDDAGFGD